MQKSVRYNEGHALYLSAVARREGSKRGVLSKRSAESHGRWSDRYFALYQNLLFYYEGEQSARPAGIYLLEGCASQHHGQQHQNPPSVQVSAPRTAAPEPPQRAGLSTTDSSTRTPPACRSQHHGQQHQNPPSVQVSAPRTAAPEPPQRAGLSTTDSSTRTPPACRSQHHGQPQRNPTS
ncbi:hypothetical protein CRUP_030763 [Coryphaenoides rupestris]|nr:hypothetical protein CRUP_030763 [Coryphaenoides rupestris]